MARRKSLRSQLYRAARDLGDIEAVEKGTYPQRMIRKAAYRRSGGLTRKLLRSFGLSR